MAIISKIKKYIPAPLRKPLGRAYALLPSIFHDYTAKREISKARRREPKLVAKVRAKNQPIRVVFFALMDSVWKFDVLYRLMEKDSRFDPVILVCPVVNYGRENMLSHMEKCYDLFKSKGYKVVKSYEIDTDRYVDVRKEINPDVIFYTNPYKGLIDDRYYISKFPDILTCYGSYYYPEGKRIPFLDQPIMNLVWKRFVETEWMYNFTKVHLKSKGGNCVISGYSGFDTLLPDHNTPKSDPWKNKDRKIKRIIWAPHHTIANYAPFSYSTFLEYYKTMLELADKYRDNIQIAFKPHPVLKNRLNIEWGEKKAEEYYKKWENLENGQLNQGAYEDLFLTSDAIMHDCGSFIGEYLVTGKPALYLSNGTPLETQFNEIAQKCISHYYMAIRKEDIETFIKNIIKNNDPKKEERVDFVKNTLLPKDGKLASQKIIDTIAKELIPD